MAQLQRVAIAPHQVLDRRVMLTAEQQHYLTRVLRLRGGDRFIAMDGQGNSWLAELEQSLSEVVVVEQLMQEDPVELPLVVVLLVALPKGSGMDEVVRQATELGVSQILPIISDRTLLNPSAQKLERWRRIAQEAAEQSERQVVPEVSAPLSFEQALKIWNSTNAVCYLCAARGNPPHLLIRLQAQPASNHSHNPRLVVATGPEGGWTESEVEQAIASGYQPVSLGRRILRAVTAPLAALSLIAATAESSQIPNR
ncbi:16S rRNA (uracil(1498)-N(3))-methyltransferase [Leptolyngbya sp. FACHB-541]|uniref:16S rRNA (uracil(1498)-N(3))-methyltransferase n=1 Tax=Leptolyngbya sp. FACHB-541 TaxID=2692810 RepID=UPI00168667F5|nr:16S rRNA (uracil(1498)-N(3))-methyltransferase [Leptolyngbya sp. FACHB-541]MBD1997017.1 16S rRNA (uracil(1498)-N(3))-methyltransferase [Leptolyngbya sp. FACHB-541]